MGLDVYLKWFDDFERTNRLETEAQDSESAIWSEYGEYKSLTQEQKDEASARVHAMYLERGLDKWGEKKEGVREIRSDSKLYPEHLFKLGYFRSSYNSGGIDRVLSMLLGDDIRLSYIFQADGGGYVTVDWQEARKRAKDVLQKLNAFLKEEGAYSVLECRYNEFRGTPINNPIKDKTSALAVFNQEVEHFDEGLQEQNVVLKQGPFDVIEVGYSSLPDQDSAEDWSPSDALKVFLQMRDMGIKFCEDDHIYNEPIKVRGIITGVRSDGIETYPCYYFIIDKGSDNNAISPTSGEVYYGFSNASGEFFFGEPAMVCGIINGFAKRFFVEEYIPVAFAIQKEAHDYQWYREALEIVIETCDYVLEQPDSEKYRLYWSA